MKPLNETTKKIIIMFAPLLLCGGFFLLLLGESFILFLVPLVIFSLIPLSLAEKLSKKDAIAYSIVQYPFYLLVVVLFTFVKPGFGFILMFPMIYIINTLFVCAYFRFVPKKSWAANIVVLILTLLITVALWSDDNGNPLTFLIFDKWLF